MKNKFQIILAITILLFSVQACESIVPETQATIPPVSITEPLEEFNPTEAIESTEPAEAQAPSDFTFKMSEEIVSRDCLTLPNLRVFSPKLINGAYVLSVNESQNISSLQLADGSLSPLHVSDFPEGHIDGLFEFDYPWYTYSETDSPQGFGDWHLHLVNVEDGSNIMIADQERYGSFSLYNALALDSGKLYLAVSNFDGAKVISSEIFEINPETKEPKLLFNNEGEPYYFSNISVSNGYLAIENNVPKTDDGRFISLYDITNGNWVNLPENKLASSPYIEYPYLVWKNYNRNANPGSLTLFNIINESSTIRDLPDSSLSTLSISKAYIIIASLGLDQSSNMIILSSLDNGNSYAIQLEGRDEIQVSGPYIDDQNFLIWAFTDIENPDQITSYVCRIPLEEVLSNSEEGIDASWN
ncbi:MAG: hypothetical protein KBA03_02380 [Anaerolineaceae bacterium]|nr:hypothetical protein [Anaerolineaceae bacterium]